MRDSACAGRNASCFQVRLERSVGCPWALTGSAVDLPSRPHDDRLDRAAVSLQARRCASWRGATADAGPCCRCCTAPWAALLPACLFLLLANSHCWWVDVSSTDGRLRGSQEKLWTACASGRESGSDGSEASVVSVRRRSATPESACRDMGKTLPPALPAGHRRTTGLRMGGCFSHDPVCGCFSALDLVWRWLLFNDWSRGRSATSL